MARSDLTEEADEGYFASISDLMVGILFVFLLMLTVFALNFRDAEEKQTVELAKYERLQKELETLTRQAEDARLRAEEAERLARSETLKAEFARLEAQRATAAAEEKQAENDRLRRLLDNAVAQLERDIAERQTRRSELLKSLETSLARQQIRVTIDENSGILRLSGDVLFRTGRSELEVDAGRTIGLLADALAESLPCYASAAAAAKGCREDAKPILETVLVEGHTDRQVYSRNDQLSTERALTVFSALLKRKPELEEQRNADGLKLLAFSGYGDRRPLPDALGALEADYRRNRRIDIRFVLSTRTSEELQKLRDQIRDALGNGAP